MQISSGRVLGVLGHNPPFKTEIKSTGGHCNQPVSPFLSHHGSIATQGQFTHVPRNPHKVWNGNLDESQEFTNVQDSALRDLPLLPF